MTTQTFRITNITCDACVKLSTKVLQKIHGVQKINIDPASGLTELEVDQEISWEQISSALHSVGKEASKLN
ncbi:MAG: heavy metal-associated domain-containing protein [Patescibacteria group bacterium]|jgi:copper chaperone CopZ